MRLATRTYCDHHWAEYQRGYRIDEELKKSTAAFLDGVDACVRYLREQVGDRMTTGRQAAQLLARIGQGETPEQAQRRQLIESMKAGS